MKGKRMAEQPKKYTHVGVLVQTQKKISILSSIQGENIYELVEAWADEAWEKAKKDGLVTDAMIQPQEQSPSEKKTKNAPARVVALVA